MADLVFHPISNIITINNIRIGGKAPKAIYKGGVEVKEVKKGNTVVYKKESGTYGIEVTLSKTNDGTSYNSSSFFSTTGITGATMAASLTIPSQVSNFQLTIDAWKGTARQFGTNYISVGKTSGSFSGTLTSSAPFFYYKYSYQPNNGSTKLTRGAINITNNMISGFVPTINLTIYQNPSSTTTQYKINIYFCNFYTGISIQSMSLGLSYNSGSGIMSSSTGGGFTGQTSWLTQRTLSFTQNSSFTGTLTALAQFHYTGTTDQPVGNVQWQIRVSDTQPTYANRKSAGKQMYVGTGILSDTVAQALYTYSITATTSGAVRYMWLCEIY